MYCPLPNGVTASKSVVDLEADHDGKDRKHEEDVIPRWNKDTMHDILDFDFFLKLYSCGSSLGTQYQTEDLPG